MVINNLEYITNSIYNMGKIVVQHGREKTFFWHQQYDKINTGNGVQVE